MNSHIFPKGHFALLMKVKIMVVAINDSIVAALDQLNVIIIR